MKNTSQRPFNKLPLKGLEDLFKALSDKFKELNVEFFVIGAIARDILFYVIFDAKIPLRGTGDVDLAVSVKSWDEYEIIIRELIKTGDFEKEKDRQRLKYKNKICIDIVPYGKIADNRHNIEWPPPELSSMMSVAGFQEAYIGAADLAISKDRDIKIASLEGLTVLKIVSWNDRKNRKDAQDLKTILVSYFALCVGELEIIYDEFSDVILEVEGDTERTGIRILGERISRLLHHSPQVQAKITSILKAELKKDGDNLAQYMVESRQELDEEYSKNTRRIKDLITGIEAC
jgi:predicted nucleotidyltransferase